MAQLVEQNQVGKREALADLIAVVESSKTPLVSALPKRGRPTNNIQLFQLKKYRRRGHKGVMDGEDASNFKHTGRKKIEAVGQKVWDNPSISDFANEAEVAGIGRQEMAEQIADSLVMVKQIQEARAGSNSDCSVDDGDDTPNATRGYFKWGDTAAQSKYPVPEGYRPSSGMRSTDALDDVTEQAFKAMLQAGFKKWRGPVDLDGFVGIDLKARMTNWSYYIPDETDHTTVRRFSTVDGKKIVSTVNFLETDAGKVRLHSTAYLMLNEETGEDSDYTHRSGLFMDMKKQWMRYTRKPKVRKLEDKGGGPRAIADCIFMLGSDNPGGILSILSNSDS